MHSFHSGSMPFRVHKGARPIHEGYPCSSRNQLRGGGRLSGVFLRPCSPDTRSWDVIEVNVEGIQV